MKKRFLVALLSLLSLSVICQAETLERHFIVELGQDGFSPGRTLSIKALQPALSGNPSYYADTHGCAGSDSLRAGKQHRLGGFEVKTSFFESISWHLLDAITLVAVYELAMTTHDAALSGTPHSWILVEAFVVVGSLLKSCWNRNSWLFTRTDQPEASQGDPFVMNITMLFGQSQNGQRESQPSASSGQQAPGATSFRLSGSFTSPPDSDSGDGNEGTEQHQHTLGLDCYVDSCRGFCKLRPSSYGRESAEWALNWEESSTGQSPHVMTEVQPFQQQSHLFTIDINPTNHWPSLHSADSGAVGATRADGREYIGQLTCDVKEVGQDDKVRSCGTVCKNATALKSHKKRDHWTPLKWLIDDIEEMGRDQGYTKHKFCGDIVVRMDGTWDPCWVSFDNDQAMMSHKTEYHFWPKNCVQSVLGERGLQSCGKVCRNSEELAYHIRMHRKRKFDARRDDDPSHSEESRD
ncbi:MULTISPECIES: hypothetical protein [unclassified Endozoicomonas]|uniref:hypothetical protein n=1 Tax=unclassified Endozoicomonas TaxID=2644528 RepID=UPI002149239A|nr:MULTISPECIES: hypothetical protein [unclassified Endozoicomonas]